MSDLKRYQLFWPVVGEGGKVVAVTAEEDSDFQAVADASQAPSTAFIIYCDAEQLTLRVFTSKGEKGASDSASLAALNFMMARGATGDTFDVNTNGQLIAAQWCTNEWLLQQGVVHVKAIAADVEPLGIHAVLPVHSAHTARTNLVVQVPDLSTLDDFVPDVAIIEALNQATDTTGLILYTLEAPADGRQHRADFSFRCFGPLKGFVEDAASSNMLACLTGVLLEQKHVDVEAQMWRAAQRKPGQPSLLSVQCAGPGQPVWVGGQAIILDKDVEA